MNRIGLINLHIEVVRCLDNAYQRITERREAIMEVLCNEELSPETRQNFEEIHNRLGAMLEGFCSAKSLFNDKLNPRMTSAERPRLVRVK